VTLAFAAGLLLLGYAFRPLRIPALPRDARVLEFVDRDGLPLGTILGRGERRTLAVPLDAVSPDFVHAVLATEDRRFFFHGAVDWAAAARALVRAPGARELPNGASTISMQVARLIEPVGGGWLGKVREIVLARRLENGAAKRAILEAYCNLAPMGSNVQGVEAAARSYFGISAARLYWRLCLTIRCAWIRTGIGPRSRCGGATCSRGWLRRDM
jgi:penicillin-binding protein 1C